MPHKNKVLRELYTQNAHMRASFQSRRPEVGMSPAQLLELRSTELAIKRVDLAIQEQRGANLRLEMERERELRRAREREQEQQQDPKFWDAALERSPEAQKEKGSQG